MGSNYTTQFISECCAKYELQEVRKIQQQSNFQLVFTDDKVYDLDKIVLLRRRDAGNTESAVHVIETADDDYADIIMVFLAIDHLLFNTDATKKYTYEQTEYTRELQQVTVINNIVTYVPYDHIVDVPNYINKINTVLNMDINPTLVQYLYGLIPDQVREMDGYIQMNTTGDDTYVDILDIFDPDNTL